MIDGAPAQRSQLGEPEARERRDDEHGAILRVLRRASEELNLVGPIEADGIRTCRDATPPAETRGRDS